MRILSIIKKFIPKKIFNFFQPAYHWLLAKTSAFVYAYPSNKLIVIGVTGTAGKSSTCYFTAQILESAGFKVGMTTTTLLKIGQKEWLNDKKMTMLGRFQSQKLLARMVKEKCQVAIIESSSEGIQQFRHISINYDILILTNLYPEHIEAHGSFENYKQAKGKLFEFLNQCKTKNLKLKIPKTILVNADDKHANYFLNFPAQQKIKFSLDKNLKTNILGEFNKYNISAGIEIAKILNIDKNKIDSAVKNLKPLPGRLEFIKNDLGLKIIVDFAFEPKALQKLYDVVKDIKHHKIIHVLGATGGGRDKARRPILGKMAAQNSDIVIVTNEDPYDENPEEIMDQVLSGTKNLPAKTYKLLDRREAIKKALKLASQGDLVLITGKGAEQAICLKNGKMLAWDDRKVVKKELFQLSS